MKRLLCAALLMLAAPVWAQDANRGEGLFADYCATCHGADARGNGEMAQILKVPTPGLRRLSADNGGSFPLVAVLAQIDGRDPLLAHGGKMPLFGHVFDGPQVALSGPGGQPVLTSGPLADLAAYLESLQN